MDSERSGPDRPAEQVAEHRPQAKSELMRIVKSEELFQGQQIVGIDHAGSIYRLQITARGKLILQK